MATEIERKFLVVGESWRGLADGVRIRQGYVSTDPERIVRIRVEQSIQAAHATLTMKGKTTGIARSEWEYPLPLTDAEAMLETLCGTALIEKIRYRIPYRDMLWELDEFFGANTGLIVAEIELESEMQFFVKPDWVGEEVSYDHRYANASLLNHPYRDWRN